jgi:hypothetical protein
MKAGKWEYSEADIRHQLQKSDQPGKEADSAELRAIHAHYQLRSGRLVIDLNNGTTIMLPVRLLDEFAGASAKDIAAVELAPRGAAVHWENLDLDFSVGGLIAAVLGSRQVMAAMGRKGGKASSEAKAAAARANGAKGGWPRKVG